MKVSFLVAEEVRQEANNKFSVLGLFVGDVVVMLKGARPPSAPKNIPDGIERLSILAIITDAPEATYQLRARLYEPSGLLYQGLPELNLGTAVTKKGASHTAIMRLVPFVIRQPGMFRLEFLVDNEVFNYSFEVREQILTASNA